MHCSCCLLYRKQKLKTCLYINYYESKVYKQTEFRNDKNQFTNEIIINVLLSNNCYLNPEWVANRYLTKATNFFPSNHPYCYNPYMMEFCNDWPILL